ncbi:hypothetical protein Plec18170_009490 [Paecilomyces lecythidis]
MASPTSPASQGLPTRSNTVRTTTTATTATNTTGGGSMSDDEVVPDENTSETTALLLERLQAWKHMCGYLEEYVSSTAKVQKSQSKDYEKILKTISEPLREAHHFNAGPNGVTELFENMKANTQGMVNMYLETEKNLKGTILPTLERLHKEIKNKAKELKSGAAKGSKAVDKARSLTQKHIELLGQHAAAVEAAAGNKIEPHHDPYVIRRGVNHRLNKQIIEENNNRNDILAVQHSFQQFENHILQTVQNAFNQFFQLMGGQNDRQRSLYADILSTAQKIPPDYEWLNFVMRNEGVLVNPDAPARSMSNISYPNQEHRATKPLVEGTLERKSRAMLKGYNTGYFVVTPARYLHEFKDNDDFRHEPSPELSLYLPDCVIGGIDGVKFSVKGKDVSSGKVGNAFHTTTELHFKASTPADAEKWWSTIKSCIDGPGAHHTATSPISPIASTATTPAGSRNVSAVQPSSSLEKELEAKGEVPTTTAAQDHAEGATAQAAEDRATATKKE